MNLFLVQHAEALSEEEDPECRLTQRGQAVLCRVAGYAAQYANIKVSRILHSSKTRAKQTAKILGSYFNPPGGVSETDGLDPKADPSIWAKRLAEIEDGVMLVGHLPHLSRLASLLLVGDSGKKIVDFQMAGIVCLKRDEAGKWSVGWVLVPEVV